MKWLLIPLIPLIVGVALTLALIWEPVRAQEDGFLQGCWISLTTSYSLYVRCDDGRYAILDLGPDGYWYPEVR